MTDKELEALFETLARRYGQNAQGARGVFTALVKITLKYRDLLVGQGEKPLTVEETRQALDVLIQTLPTKKFHPDTPERIRKLVTLWHDELKVFLYH